MSDPVRVPASPAHCRWGAFDASFAPVASIDPGGLVILECLSGGPEAMPPQEKMMAVHPMLREVHAKVPRLGAHIITIDPGQDVVMARCKAERPWQIQQAAKHWYAAQQTRAASQQTSGTPAALGWFDAPAST